MKIVIFQPMLKFYRVPLFERLHKQLADQGHELRLVFGTPWEAEQKRNDNVVVENDYCFFEKSHWFFDNKLHFLNGALSHIRWADVVITEQANRHVHNYILIVLRWLGKKPFAYWGHGQNRQGNSNSIKEIIKKMLATQVDWWFAYTSGVADYLKDLGFPEERITILNNSVDTRAFKQDLDNLASMDIANFKQRHRIADDAKIGLFCGSLHQDKRIGFLLESAKRIKQKDPSFVLVIIGDGPNRNLVTSCADSQDFIIYLGALRGKEKAVAFKIADLFLNPGMVGLAILDAFSAGLPLLTTRQAEHSPEIDYLQTGYNGMLSDLDIEAYSGLVVSALESSSVLESLKKNARASSEHYSIENMANNFSKGIAAFAALHNRSGHD